MHEKLYLPRKTKGVTKICRLSWLTNSAGKQVSYCYKYFGWILISPTTLRFHQLIHTHSLIVIIGDSLLYAYPCFFLYIFEASPASECASPLEPKGGATLSWGWGGGGPNSDDWTESLALCKLCGGVGGCCGSITKNKEIYTINKAEVLFSYSVYMSWCFPYFQISNRTF